MEDIQVALVTGANQGIGLQIARHRASHGFTVLVGARNLERGEAVAKSIHGDQALQLDVTDRASIAAAAERIRDEFGRLDVLINNAAMSNTGLRPGMTVGEYSKSPRQSNVSLDEARTVWETNVFGSLLFTKRRCPCCARRYTYALSECRAMQLAGRDGNKLVWGPPRDVDGAIALLREVVASGVNHIDTADFYGPHVMNQIIRKALSPYAYHLVIVTKVSTAARRGWLMDPRILPRGTDQGRSRQSSQSGTPRARSGQSARHV